MLLTECLLWASAVFALCVVLYVLLSMKVDQLFNRVHGNADDCATGRCQDCPLVLHCPTNTSDSSEETCK